MFGMFKRNNAKPSPEQDQPLMLVPVPPLVALLANREREKGSPLTEAEVNEMRDNCVCINLPLSEARKMAEARGYDDINPEVAWDQWQVAREQLRNPGEGV